MMRPEIKNVCFALCFGLLSVAAFGMEATRVPVGDTTFVIPATSEWKWTDLCRSMDTPCFGGEWIKNGDISGYSHVNAAQLSGKQAVMRPEQECREIFEGLKAKAKVTSYRLMKSRGGQSTCQVFGASEQFYFWKNQQALVALTFVSKSGGSTAGVSKDFLRAVNSLISEAGFESK